MRDSLPIKTKIKGKIKNEKHIKKNDHINSKVKIVHCDLQKISKIPNSMNDVLSITKKIDIIYHIAGGGLGFHNPLINTKDFLKVFNLNFLSILEINQICDLGGKL